MTAPAYATDLQIVSDAETTTGWSEMTGRTSGGAQTQEDRAYIQGNYCVSQSTGAASGRTVGLQYDYGSNISWSTGYVFLVWQYWQAPKAIGVWADGGIRFGVGSTTGNIKLWNTQGSDYGRNPYGGWDCVAIDPTYTADETIGSPVTGNYRIFCSAPYMLSSVSKGNPHCVDIIRYGRGQLKIEFGSTTDGYGTFAGMATANDADSARWGLFSNQYGQYIWKGLISFGTATNAVDFRDANRNIAIDNTPRTYAAFNKIEINNASSRVDWTAIQIYSLGTLSKGTFEVVHNATVNILNCTFTDMFTFVFQSNSVITGTIFRRCGLVTQASSTFSKCSFDNTTDSASLLCNNPTAVSGCTFISDGSNHAIELTSACAGNSYNLSGHTFIGYATTNGTSGNEVIYNNSGGAVTLNASNCTGTISVRNGTGASTTIVSGTVSVTILVKTVDGSSIQNAMVLVRAANNTGPFPYDVTVTISNSGTTATVTHTAHGLATNDKIQISGASLTANNGIFSITKINDNSYSYTMASTPGSSPTGTIKATYVAINGLTDANGSITMSRVFSSNQPVIGWARKSSGTPYYKQGPINGTIDSTTGFSTTAVLIAD